jgi:predicted Fe-Mo cluster-binding NifX family protein
MKIAITAHGENLWSPVDSRFSKAIHIIIYDQKTNAWDCWTNKKNMEGIHGSGTSVFQALAQAGVSILITGHVGPKVFKELNAGEIDIYSFGDLKGSVEDALAAFWGGKLTAITVPNGIDIKK